MKKKKEGRCRVETIQYLNFRLGIQTKLQDFDWCTVPQWALQITVYLIMLPHDLNYSKQSQTTPIDSKCVS